MFHSLKHFFFWLSGAGSETLEQCPNWEQRKYVAFGATVLVPCAFAFIACAYALSTITDKAAIIFPVAFVWAFIILTIDRAYGVAEEKKNKRVGDGEAHENRYHETKSEL